MKLFKITFKSTLMVAALATLAATGSSVAFAQHGGMGQHPPGDKIVKLLNLDATRAAQVVAIMTEQRTQGKAIWAANKGNTDPAARQAAREQMHVIAQQSRAKLATVLTAAEMAQLKEARKGMRHHGQDLKQG
jgi:hypothetical protein